MFKVGAGGSPAPSGGTAAGTTHKGETSYIQLSGTTILSAEGGGAGKSQSGGSGGGGYNTTGGSVGTSGTAGNSSVIIYNGSTGVKYGNKGGDGRVTSGPFYEPGGGGGAGEAGYNYGFDPIMGYSGGNGIYQATVNSTTYNFVSVFGTSSGVYDGRDNTRRYFGGGGGVISYNSSTITSRWPGSRATGGGGIPNPGGNTILYNGIPNSGGGGAGGVPSGITPYPNVGLGGSGIILLRYSTIPETNIMLLGCSNLVDTYEENFAYRQGVAYTNTYFSSNPWTIPAPAPILRSSAHNYNSYSNLIFSSYFASNFDYQYSSNISTLNSGIVANPANTTFYQNFHDNADATRLTIGDRNITNLNFVFTEVETNIRLQTGYYYFMLDLQNEVTADLLLGEQSDTSIDNYLNVANYYNSNLLNSPAATIAHTSNQVLTYPLYIPEGYYRFYLRMLRTINNRHNKYFIPQYYYTNTWTSPSYSLNNSNAFTYISYNTLNSTYQTGRTLNINDRFVVNNNATGATSNLYVYRYFDNTTLACGLNGSGQLGVTSVTTDTTRFIPTQVLNISGITQIAAGSYHSLFLRVSDGAVFACGYNAFGQLGVHVSDTANRFIPTQVLNYSGGTGTYISGITQIAAGLYHSLFRRSDGAVFACGENTSGQLGVTSVTTDTANRFKPTQVLNYSGGTGTYISGITQIATGQSHSLFRRSDDAVFACGYNYWGQLGVHASDTTNRFIPTQVLNISGITQIAAGAYHSLFIAKILPVLVNVSNYTYNISHSNIITPNTFFAANRYSSSNLLNIQDFKIFNNPTVMGSDFSINNILYTGKDSSNLVAINKIRFNKWQETSDYASLTNKYVYYTEGNVGIGNTVPTTASLDINTSVLTAYDNSTIYSMKTNRPVWTNLGLITSSDERIKKNLKDIDDNTALNQILKIEPKSYNYMDKNNTTSNIYGFIAQQIRTVIPQAVSMHTEAVPNIYTIGSIIANNITVSFTNPVSGIKKVLLIDILGNRYVEAVVSSQQTEGTLQIEIENTNKIPDGQIFIYGTIVDDFHALDKSYIYTLNVCALQDIYKSYANLKDQLTLCTANYSNILPLQDTLTSTLSEYNSAITSSYSSLTTTQKELQNQVDFLKHANNTLMQNIETYKQSQSSNCIELEHLQAENNILTSANNEITKEHESLIKQISEQSQEIFTIKSILQLNNIV